MKTTTWITTARPRLFAILAFAVPLLALASSMAAAAGGERIAFKLDPRLTSGLYMGERWVSPNTYTQLSDGGGRLAVAARSSTPVQWQATDAGVVTISPATGSEVILTVNHAGATTVAAGSKYLAVKATETAGGSLKVEISQ